ncbi:MAG: SMC-Scp complex subunit ScpB [Solobacterium sp.]|nr:SMC-Scp complex subunit ScpB [Solobacterium sp.]
MSEIDNRETNVFIDVDELTDHAEAPEENAEDVQPAAEEENALQEGRAKAILEGLLFVTGDEGITAEQAAASLDITKEQTEALFDDLMKEYCDESRGMEIGNFGGIYRFLSKAFVHDYARKLFALDSAPKLSNAALETLAIIAYKGPVTRVEIEEIRGVGADMMLRKLLARDMIRESGRSEAPGRPILYEVTEEFMNSFKLLSLKELPELPKFGDNDESRDLFE